MKTYADSNFFCRVYLELDTGTAAAASLIEMIRSGLHPPLPITRLHRLEVMNAFELMAFQSVKQGQHRITREAAAVAQATFRDDCREAVFLQLRSPDEAAVDRQYEELVLRHTAQRGFRTYDLLHVSQALVLGCDTFWSFDEKSNALAALEGLQVHVSGL